MPKIEYHRTFAKHYSMRIAQNPKLDKLFNQKLQQFVSGSGVSTLRCHQLTGAKKGYYSFSLTGDIRVVYTYKDKDTVIFVDIGSHNQVY